jgi:hypothetical protein
MEVAKSTPAPYVVDGRGFGPPRGVWHFGVPGDFHSAKEGTMDIAVTFGGRRQFQGATRELAAALHTNPLGSKVMSADPPTCSSAPDINRTRIRDGLVALLPLLPRKTA